MPDIGGIGVIAGPGVPPSGGGADSFPETDDFYAFYSPIESPGDMFDSSSEAFSSPTALVVEKYPEKVPQAPPSPEEEELQRRIRFIRRWLENFHWFKRLQEIEDAKKLLEARETVFHGPGNPSPPPKLGDSPAADAAKRLKFKIIMDRLGPILEHLYGY